jgi:branched-chain amino acid transport system substrate-binding protein
MIRGAVLFALAVLLAVGAARPARAADPYDVDVLLSLTGAGAFLGQSEAKSIAAIELLANKAGGINGRPVHFVVQDDQSSPQVAVQLANALIAKGVPIILGPGYSATCYAVLPIVAKSGPVQYCYAPSVHTVAPSFVFSAGVSTKDLALGGLRFFRERGLRKIAILVTTDATGQDGENVIREDLALPENASMSLVATEHFTPGDISISAQLSRLKSSGAQVVIAWVTGTPFGTVLKGAVDNDLGLPILTNAGNLSVVQMTQYASFVPKDLYFTGFRFLRYKLAGPGPVRDADERFFSALAAVGVTNPDGTYSSNWDATLVALDALRHVGPNPTAERIRAYIAGLHDFPGINGIMDFRDGQQRGYKDNAGLIVQWNATQKTFVPVSLPGGYLK